MGEKIFCMAKILKGQCVCSSKAKILVLHYPDIFGKKIS